MDLEEITGANSDRARNASTAESNSDDRQSDELLDDEATLRGAKHFGATM